MPIFVPYEFPQTKDGQFFALQSDDRIFFSRRQQLNITQQELAERAGVPLRQIQRLEAGTSDIRNCPMDTALSICAALLLDPYQFIHISKQPDPDSLTPLPPLEDFSMEDPFHRKKKAGRKPIRRDVMTVFFHSPVFSVMIPRHVLEAIGKPTALDGRKAITGFCFKAIMIPVFSIFLKKSIPKHLIWPFLLPQSLIK